MINTVAEIKRLCLFVASEEDDRINYDTKLANIQRKFGKIDTKVADVGDFFIYTNKKETHYIVNDCGQSTLYALRLPSFLEKALSQPVPKSLIDEMEQDGTNKGHYFQDRVDKFMLECFGEEVAYNIQERNFRFVEESLELAQSCGATRQECLQLVDYVFNRCIGEKNQEVGGVLITLAALCTANKIDMDICGEQELSRVWTVIDKIRKKHFSKTLRTPLPGKTQPE